MIANYVEGPERSRFLDRGGLVRDNSGPFEGRAPWARTAMRP